MDNMVSLLKAYGSAAVNDEVKGKILELIQNWAAAAERRPNLSYLQEVYTTLQREGFQFPPKQSVASSMFDSSAVSLYHRSQPLSDTCSLLNGLIRTFVCAVEPPFPLQIVSIIAAIVEECSVGLAPVKLHHSHIWV
jgi:hypothetical protein